MKTLCISAVLSLSLFISPSPGQDSVDFDYFVNNWNVVGLKDYPRGARISPDNHVHLDESNGTVEIRYGRDLVLLTRQHGKSTFGGWMPVTIVNTEEDGIRYEFTIWATPMPDVKNWQKAFDWPTEGENFTVWIRYTVTNISDKPSLAKLLIQCKPRKTSGHHLVDKILAPGEALEQAARFPFFKIEDPDALQQADYQTWFQRTVEYWEQMRKTIASIEVPDPKATEALRASHVCQMIANDLGEVRGGEGFYDEFYIRDGAYQVMELEEAGMWEAARKSIELYLPRQREDGRFESQAGQFDANGQALWVLWNYYKMTGDRSFLERVYPAMKKATDWTIRTLDETANHPGFPGLLPAALADGEYLWAGKNHIVGYDFWNLRGLLVTAGAARVLDREQEASELEMRAGLYRSAINAVMVRLGLDHFPPSWERIGTHWGNTETLWPTPIFPAGDPRIASLVEFLRDDFAGGYVEGTIRWMGHADVIHPYMGAYTTMADLIMGNDERVVQDFYWYLLHSTASHAFPEGIYYKTKTAWGNTIPHVTGACNYAIMLRHMLVHEEGSELHLLKAVPDWWLASGEEIRIERLPTWFGEISLHIRGMDRGIELKLEGPSREKPSRIVLHLPDNRILTNQLDGIEVETRKPQKERWDFGKVIGLYRSEQEDPVGSVRFGVMTDVHKDIMHDADIRLGSFIHSMIAHQPDFIIQLGDFCQPVAKNREFLNIWNSYPGHRYHVLGNHDMDGGFTRDSAVSYLGSAGRYYSFDRGGFHFVVLDCNEVNPSPGRPPGYARYVGKEQQEWLRCDLKKAGLPTVVFSHQPVLTGIDNPDEILNILVESGKANPAGRVIACFNGHDHANQAKQVNHIWFIQVNSMSYDWLGDDYKHASYPDSIHTRYPYIQYTAPYREPLWALVTIWTDGRIRLSGRQSEWVGPSPGELGHPGKGKGLEFSAEILDTLLRYER